MPSIIIICLSQFDHWKHYHHHHHHNQWACTTSPGLWNPKIVLYSLKCWIIISVFHFILELYNRTTQVGNGAPFFLLTTLFMSFCLPIIIFINNQIWSMVSEAVGLFVVISSYHHYHQNQLQQHNNHFNNHHHFHCDYHHHHHQTNYVVIIGKCFIIRRQNVDSWIFQRIGQSTEFQQWTSNIKSLSPLRV